MDNRGSAAKHRLAELGRPAHRSAESCRGDGGPGGSQRIIVHVLPPLLQASNLQPQAPDPALVESPLLITTSRGSHEGPIRESFEPAHALGKA
jgi:hypothetical protein